MTNNFPVDKITMLMVPSKPVFFRYFLLALLTLTLLGLVGHYTFAPVCGTVFAATSDTCSDATRGGVTASAVPSCALHSGFLSPIVFGINLTLFVMCGGVLAAVFFPRAHSRRILHPPIF